MKSSLCIDGVYLLILRQELVLKSTIAKLLQAFYNPLLLLVLVLLLVLLVLAFLATSFSTSSYYCNYSCTYCSYYCLMCDQCNAGPFANALALSRP